MSDSKIVDVYGDFTDSFKVLIKSTGLLSTQIARMTVDWCNANNVTVEQRELAILAIRDIVASEIALQSLLIEHSE